MSQFRIQKTEESNAGERQTPFLHLIGMRLGTEEYVVEISRMREIIMLDEITYVPRVADYFEGVINLRGEVVPAINLRLRLGMANADFTSQTRIIVTQFGDVAAGFLVDAITRVLKIPESSMEEATSSMGEVSAEYLKGIGRTENNIVGWLDLEKLAA